MNKKIHETPKKPSSIVLQCDAVGMSFMKAVCVVSGLKQPDALRWLIDQFVKNCHKTNEFQSLIALYNAILEKEQKLNFSKKKVSICGNIIPTLEV